MQLPGLRAARKAQRYSQRQLAEALQVHIGTVNRWELGQCDPSTRDLRRLSALLGVSIDALLAVPDAAQDESPRPAERAS